MGGNEMERVEAVKILENHVAQRDERSYEQCLPSCNIAQVRKVELMRETQSIFVIDGADKVSEPTYISLIKCKRDAL